MFLYTLYICMLFFAFLSFISFSLYTFFYIIFVLLKFLFSFILIHFYFTFCLCLSHTMGSLLTIQHVRWFFFFFVLRLPVSLSKLHLQIIPISHVTRHLRFTQEQITLIHFILTQTLNITHLITNTHTKLLLIEFNLLLMFFFYYC